VRGWAATIKKLNVFIDSGGEVVIHHPSLESLKLFAECDWLKVSVFAAERTLGGFFEIGRPTKN
jgi:hypothetical protein